MAQLGYSNSMSADGSSIHGQSVQIVPFKTSQVSLKMLLLHGNLDIWVKGANNLPNMDMFHKKLNDLFSIIPGGSKKGNGSAAAKNTSDPYVTVSVADAVIARTFVIHNSENPEWMQHFHVPVAHNAAEIHFVVKDSDIVGSQIIGAVGIPVEQVISGARVEGTFPILNTNGKPFKPAAVLSLSIQYIPMENVHLYHGGVGADHQHQGVPGTYFPIRRGGRVTLYQDAHVHENSLPNIWLESGVYYQHGRCWHDIFDAISQARRLIYITGWSVYHLVSLVRDSGDAKKSILGNILKAKSQEGVRVLLLVWDDPTSRSILGYKTRVAVLHALLSNSFAQYPADETDSLKQKETLADLFEGVMGTGDEETRRFFKHSSVQVLLCPRAAGKGHSWVKKKEVGTIYTHHQKNVIVDADAGNFRRKIVAFIGGLDLTAGRYDTPDHPLFRSLQTVHKDDFHNPNYTGPTTGCPREPWHDLHCRVDGPAAYDILTNFQERWLKAAKHHGFQKIKGSNDDSLLKLERIPDILGIEEASSAYHNDFEAWNVQIFRSIDSSSVKGFPKDPKDATEKNLLCGKNVLIDMSIHTAYVKAIRAAQHFIYIENQYFLGSSFNWSNHKDLGANNLIPMEIALKIANKIRAHERFSAYIVLPMWPEGVPTSTPTQRILYWQNKTMQMMYGIIYEALVEVGLERTHEPQDFLIFFCLGNREAHGSQSDAKSSCAPNTPQAQSHKSRRFMIYVHSKGMIVDDEYVILGSANINQRSLEGTRDTEIAMGGYQPNYTWGTRHKPPQGQIYGYRMSLWAEHIGVLEKAFEQPESLDCVRRVRALSELNWSQYAAEEITEMRGHLMKYPVFVDRTGKVSSLPGSETFPDMGGNIVGTFVAIQENLTI